MTISDSQGRCRHASSVLGNCVGTSMASPYGREDHGWEKRLTHGTVWVCLPNAPVVLWLNCWLIHRCRHYRHTRSCHADSLLPGGIHETFDDGTVIHTLH